MSDLLQFLNTANADSLARIPGISQSLAENLIAARPFESIEDCLKVRGMGKNLLSRIQASFEKEEAPLAEPVITSQEQAIIPTAPQEAPEIAPAEKTASPAETPPANPGPSFGSRLGKAFLWFFRALVRLILIILVIGGIGAAVYYGVPYLQQTFVAPVEQNSARVTELESEIASLQGQLDEIKGQVTELNTQLNGVNDQMEDAAARIEALDQSIESHTASLEQLEEMDAALETRITETNDLTLLALKNEIALTRVLDLLARARLYLAQSNFGLAKADTQSARDLLAELQASAADEAQAQAVERLDLALGNLPDFPVVASGDIEIAWQILMTGQALPTSTPEPASTPVPGATLTPTPGTTPTP
jgi:cell division protein FtsB